MSEPRRAMRRIHAVAAKAGIGKTSKESHDFLHNWAVQERKVASLSDVPDVNLDAMADWIEENPDHMAAYFDAFAPIEIEPMDYDDPLAVDVELFTPDEWAELHAAADAIQERYR